MSSPIHQSKFKVLITFEISKLEDGKKIHLATKPWIYYLVHHSKQILNIQTNHD